MTLPSDIQEAVETLRAFLDGQRQIVDQVDGTHESRVRPSARPSIEALATLTEHLEWLKRERDEEIGYRDEYQRLWHRDVARVRELEAALKDLTMWAKNWSSWSTSARGWADVQEIVRATAMLQKEER